jgi:hypothetical protein
MDSIKEYRNCIELMNKEEIDEVELFSLIGKLPDKYQLKIASRCECSDYLMKNICKGIYTRLSKKKSK